MSEDEDISDILDEDIFLIKTGKGVNIGKAIENCNAAIDKAEEAKDQYLKIKAYLTLQHIYANNNNLEKALEQGEKALELAKNSEDEYYIIVARLALMQTCRKKGEFERGIAYGEDAKTEALELGKLRILAKIYGILGLLYSKSDNLSMAIIENENALELEEKLGNEVAKIGVLLALGVNYAFNNEHEKSYKCNKEAMELAKKHKKHREGVKASLGIAAVYTNSWRDSKSQTRLEKAEKLIDKALKVAEKLKDDQLVINCYKAHATNYYQRSIRGDRHQVLDWKKCVAYNILAVEKCLEIGEYNMAANLLFFSRPPLLKMKKGACVNHVNSIILYLLEDKKAVLGSSKLRVIQSACRSYNIGKAGEKNITEMLTFILRDVSDRGFKPLVDIRK